MTANQVAAQQTINNKEIAMKQLDETNRHNQELESIEKSKLDYQKEALRISSDWNEYQKSWNQEFVAKYKQLEWAQEEEKIAIQQELAELESDKVRIDEDYKSKVAYNQSVANELTKEANRITEDWNKHKESVDWISLGNTQYELFLRNKQIEYENNLRHEQNVITHDLGMAQNQLGYFKANNDYNLGIAQNTLGYANLNFAREQMNRNLQNQYGIAMLSAGVRQQELALQQRKYEEMDLVNSKFQNFQYLSSGLFGRSGMIPGSFEVVKTFIPIGGNYVPKKAFEKLFK